MEHVESALCCLCVCVPLHSCVHNINISLNHKCVRLTFADVSIDESLIRTHIYCVSLKEIVCSDLWVL